MERVPKTSNEKSGINVIVGSFSISWSFFKQFFGAGAGGFDFFTLYRIIHVWCVLRLEADPLVVSHGGIETVGVIAYGLPIWRSSTNGLNAFIFFFGNYS